MGVITVQQSLKKSFTLPNIDYSPFLRFPTTTTAIAATAAAAAIPEAAPVSGLSVLSALLPAEEVPLDVVLLVESVAAVGLLVVESVVLPSVEFVESVALFSMR